MYVDAEAVKALPVTAKVTQWMDYLTQNNDAGC